MGDNKTLTVLFRYINSSFLRKRKHFYPYVQLHSHESFRFQHRRTYLKFIAHHVHECSLDTKVPDTSSLNFVTF